MTVREYIGARYVPLFIGEWDNTVTYEPLSIVIYQGNSYTSRQYVPIGIDITNDVYWAETGNFNAQIEAYREEVLQYTGAINELEGTVSPYTSENTVYSHVSEAETDITELQATVYPYTSDNTIATDIQGIKDTLTPFNSSNTVNRRINQVNYRINTNDNVEVTDWEHYAILPDPPVGGTLQGMAYDANSDILYLAYFMSGTNSVIRRFQNFSQADPQEALQYDATLTIENNHCNSLSIYDGNLYCSYWNGTYITKIPLSTFNSYTNINAGFALRTAIRGQYCWLIEPYSANCIWAFYENSNYPDDIRTHSLGKKLYTSSQLSWVQDCKEYHGCLVRLCSGSYGLQGRACSYIELFSALNATEPVTASIAYNDRMDIEYEGIAFDSSYCYLSFGNEIIRSHQMIDVLPQVRWDDGFAPARQWSREYNSIIYPPGAYNSLPYTITDNKMVIAVPEALQSWLSNATSNPVLYFTLLGCNLNGLKTVNMSILLRHTIAAKYITGIIPGAANGYYLALFTVYWDTSAHTITLTPLRGYGIGDTGTTTKYDITAVCDNSSTVFLV